ncbi:alpha-ketoglutarate-dependent dioxygenase AlkB [Luteimonas sp. BDR2-5]|uniref:alpha-ketoglutarate-dependent dioxygenase AlkB family protein n=1 Tax=Proluteimonas luteida TaxID=2878685 RepID=UPI001E4501F9|nr:alpha-ketoglutarate-dependent dioxygenase AlkB [Luteimonas sp. BDR2-5]MCD9027320.1 alpha-ketoglutarate-dependent dioxygenase AlkB [Luteimonas sp. BDR2-5]
MDKTFESLTLPGASLAWCPGWLDPDASRALFVALMAQVPWQQHHVRLFGRCVAAPRLSCWIGDPDASYAYSGTRFAPHPWPDALRAVRDAVGEAAGVRFNSVLANLYRDGRDGMGWHSDDERELGPGPVIASLSLGATRRFSFKHRTRPGVGLTLPLPAGSLLLMRGATQQHYRHALPKTARPVGPRINLTFRRILG